MNDTPISGAADAAICCTIHTTAPTSCMAHRAPFITTANTTPLFHPILPNDMMGVIIDSLPFVNVMRLHLCDKWTYLLTIRHIRRLVLNSSTLSEDFPDVILRPTGPVCASASPDASMLRNLCITYRLLDTFRNIRIVMLSEFITTKNVSINHAIFNALQRLPLLGTLTCAAELFLCNVGNPHSLHLGIEHLVFHNVLWSHLPSNVDLPNIKSLLFGKYRYDNGHMPYLYNAIQRFPTLTKVCVADVEGARKVIALAPHISRLCVTRMPHRGRDSQSYFADIIDGFSSISFPFGTRIHDIIGERCYLSLTDLRQTPPPAPWCCYKQIQCILRDANHDSVKSEASDVRLCDTFLDDTCIDMLNAFKYANVHMKDALQASAEFFRATTIHLRHVKKLYIFVQTLFSENPITWCMPLLEELDIVGPKTGIGTPENNPTLLRSCLAASSSPSPLYIVQTPALQSLSLYVRAHQLLFYKDFHRTCTHSWRHVTTLRFLDTSYLVYFASVNSFPHLRHVAYCFLRRRMFTKVPPAIVRYHVAKLCLLTWDSLIQLDIDTHENEFGLYVQGNRCPDDYTYAPIDVRLTLPQVAEIRDMFCQHPSILMANGNADFRFEYYNNINAPSHFGYRWWSDPEPTFFYTRPAPPFTRYQEMRKEGKALVIQQLASVVGLDLNNV